MVPKAMKKRLLIAAYVFLNALFLFAMWVCIGIYTSMMGDNPERCGMQFMLLLVFNFPFLVVIGLLQLVVGRFLPISHLIRALPFFAAVILQIPAILDTSLKNTGLQITGAAMSAATGGLILVLVTRDLLKLRREQAMPGPTDNAG